MKRFVEMKTTRYFKGTLGTLAKLAKAQKVSVDTVIRTAIAEYIERMK